MKYNKLNAIGYANVYSNCITHINSLSQKIKIYESVGASPK